MLAIPLIGGAALRREKGSRCSLRMPFAEPETALAATIDSGDDKYFVDGTKARPGAPMAPLRLFNDFHEGSTTYEKSPSAPA